jgi:hypothetical protein
MLLPAMLSENGSVNSMKVDYPKLLVLIGTLDKNMAHLDVVSGTV